MDDCHYRTVLLRVDHGGRPWYEDVDTGERIEIGTPDFADASVRTGEINAVIVSGGHEIPERTVGNVSCVQYAQGQAWIGRNGAWDPWQRALGGQAVTAAQAILQRVRLHDGGSPPAAVSLTSESVVKPDRATLLLIDAEVREHGRDRWSSAAPGFYIVGPYGGPGTFAEAIDSSSSLGSSAGWYWFVVDSDSSAPISANGGIARSAKHFATPSGNEVWAVDQMLTLWEDCAQLVVPPISPGPIEPGVETGIDTDGGIVTASIDDADGEGYTLVAVMYEDPACRAHPVMGPIIDHLLE